MKSNTDKHTKGKITMTGIVVSTKADKTVSVDIERIFQHSVYKKIVRKKKKYLAHDAANKCQPGDIVKIQLVRPISKRKRWLVVDVIKKAQGKEALPTDQEVLK
ncbi:MAG: 30S ribosomal protein S17 [Candidatus Aminicenantes bacterium]|nr:30S ribosomal protein S17 [Candidatus Aminicenantes bacterium]